MPAEDKALERVRSDLYARITKHAPMWGYGWRFSDTDESPVLWPNVCVLCKGDDAFEVVVTVRRRRP